jgi:hypothetical protein
MRKDQGLKILQGQVSVFSYSYILHQRVKYAKKSGTWMILALNTFNQKEHKVHTSTLSNTNIFVAFVPASVNFVLKL